MNRPPVDLHIVAGAPGSGKSTAVHASQNAGLDFCALDMDDLIAPASALVGKDIHFARETWAPYSALWAQVLLAIARNAITPVLFAPDAFTFDIPAFGTVHHLILDCPDAIRTQRLTARNWPEHRIAEAIEDAAALRNLPRAPVLNSNDHKPAAIARQINDWVQMTTMARPG